MQSGALKLSLFLIIPAILVCVVLFAKDINYLIFSCQKFEFFSDTPDSKINNFILSLESYTKNNQQLTINVDGEDYTIDIEKFSPHVNDELLQSDLRDFFSDNKINSLVYCHDSLGGFFDINNYIQFDDEVIASALQYWHEDLGLKKLNNDKIEIIDNSFLVTPGNPGHIFNEKDFKNKLVKSIMGNTKKPHIKIKSSTKQPQTNQKELQELANLGNWLLEDDLIFKNDTIPESKILDQEKILPLLTLESDEEELNYYIKIKNEELLSKLSLPLNQPKDAEFVFDNNGYVDIIPSTPGLSIDDDILFANIKTSFNIGEREVELPLVAKAEPNFTTKDAKDLNIRHLISEFTTYHPCCQDRVTNIQTMADMIDGLILLPNETFSLNEAVGMRTEENGFKPAGTILKGIMVDTVGGGVSQFATTLYNSIYWGGYRIITHKPHSRYFSRYPEGIEATVSWPTPNLIFQNDTDNAILLKTSYTNNSITVGIYGDNDGRIVSGYHQNNQTISRVKEPGGHNSRVVQSRVTDRFNRKDPKEEYRIDPLVPEGEIYTNNLGRVGWSLSVYRTVTESGQTIKQENWPVTYIPEPKILLVKDCLYAPTGATCQSEADREEMKERLVEMFTFKE